MKKVLLVIWAVFFMLPCMAKKYCNVVMRPRGIFNPYKTEVYVSKSEGLCEGDTIVVLPAKSVLSVEITFQDAEHNVLHIERLAPLDNFEFTYVLPDIPETAFIRVRDNRGEVYIIED